MKKYTELLVKYKKKLQFVAILLFMMSVIYSYSDLIFDSKVMEPYGQEEVQKLSDGDEVQQRIDFKKSGKPYVLSLQFEKEATGSSGVIGFALSADGEELSTWSVNVSDMSESGAFDLDISNFSQRLSKASDCILNITAKETKGVSLVLSKQETNGVYNNNTLEGEGIYYRYTYADSSGKIFSYVLLAVFLGLSVFFFIWKEKKIGMILILVVMSLFYFLKTPVGTVPDEPHHFYRAFEISCGNLVSKHLGDDGIGGNELPGGIKKYAEKEAVLDWNKTALVEFGNTALYSPITYLPQAIGIKIARLFTDHTYEIYMMGRLAAMIVNMVLCSFALWKIPVAKEVVFAILLFPMSIQEMISMAPDGLIIALSMAFLALCLDLAYKKEKVTKKDMVLLLSIAIGISLCKIVYVVICLLPLLIPTDKFSSKKKARIFQWGIFGISFLVNILWTTVALNYFVEFMEGVNSGAQIKYVLSNLLRFYIISIRTTLANGGIWIPWMFGSALGALNVATNWTIWFVYLVYLTSLTMDQKIYLRTRKSDCLVYYFIFLGGVGLIFTSLYVQWTSYGKIIIDGIQGRYFIPLLMFILLPVIYAKGRSGDAKTLLEEKGAFAIGLIPMCINCIALIDLYNYYL